MNLAQWFITQTGLIREYKQDLPPNMTYRLKIKNIYLLTLCATPFLALFVFSNNVNATSIDCSVDTNTSRLDLSTACNISTLDGSKDWYYTLRFVVKPDSTYHSPCLLRSDVSQYCGRNFPFIPLTQTYANARYSTSTTNTVIFSDSFTSTGNHFHQFYGDGSYLNEQLTSLSISIADDIGGSCPPAPVCPECEDCDTPAIVAFFRDVFLNTVTGVIPAFAIFVVVWFMVDLLSSLWFGRGK